MYHTDMYTELEKMQAVREMSHFEKCHSDKDFNTIIPALIQTQISGQKDTADKVWSLKQVLSPRTQCLGLRRINLKYVHPTDAAFSAEQLTY